MPNTHADANATKLFRRVGVGGVYWALGFFYEVRSKNNKKS